MALLTWDSLHRSLIFRPASDAFKLDTICVSANLDLRKISPPPNDGRKDLMLPYALFGEAYEFTRLTVVLRYQVLLNLGSCQTNWQHSMQWNIHHIYFPIP